MSPKWQIQDAKNRLSEVVDLAIKEGPQAVTRRGKEVAVILSTADFARLRKTGRRGRFVTFMRGLRFTGENLELERSADVSRDLDLA